MYRFELCEADTPSLRFEVNETIQVPYNLPSNAPSVGRLSLLLAFEGFSYAWQPGCAGSKQQKLWSGQASCDVGQSVALHDALGAGQLRPGVALTMELFA